MGFFIDWLSRLKEHASSEAAELDITELRPGDVVRIGTLNTIYTLRLLDGARHAEMKTDREDRPAGPVRIMGCTFGLSTTISPDHVFCGGNLELSFVREGVRMTHTTSEIRRIEWIRQAA